MSGKVAILIGNTDGIGAGTTKRLLQEDYRVFGISKRNSTVDHPKYSHIIQDVCSSDYRLRLTELLTLVPIVDVCIYFAGVGDELDWKDLSRETRAFEVNLMSAVITTEVVLTRMLDQTHGHFIGLSSVADSIISSEAPSYCASKSGISKFWEGIGLAAKKKKIKVSNIRFGFVDTKMAKSPVRPLLISVDDAVDFICGVIKNPRIRATKPKLIIPLVWLAGLFNRLRLMFL